ncbi:Apolipoprotein N-acyltransferase [Bernardetia litoralis DSM 6794]|uniref:Apolipoprotein N-acyltransferase n=1 Tax=Bernardetia litoralis (strain ATCC 23117 / DSM 6794 / NBRC 15988 / NCIMB 1366 / Fx l1 / Sio-4) TaxID=880071 RepID=I4AJL0_BERLS|nr:apolipoprotein N-acyltransferase [Bernardetia litoralis]AFM04145.1 Apolipoprotein N-acyltransferase [Bernardetia litoralis DSM 6794]
MSALLSFQAHLEEYRQKKYYALTLSVLGGVLMALGWYFPFSPFLFVGLVPLIELIDFYFKKHEEQKSRSKETSFKKKRYFTRLCFFIWIYFVIWNAGVYWWLWNAVSVAVIGIFLLNAFLQLLPIIVYIFTRRFSVGFINYLSLVSCWLFFEYIHLNWVLSYPWMNIGNAFGEVPTWVQWYEYTGAFGGTLWVLLANLLAYHVFIKSDVKVGAFMVWILVPIGISYSIYISYDDEKLSTSKTVEMAVLQPNLDCYSEKFANNPQTGEPSENHISFQNQIQRYIDLAKSTITDSTKYIILPETAFHQNSTEYNYTSQPDLKPIFDFCRENNLILISGADTYKFYTGNDTIPKTARKSKGRNSYYDMYNSAVQFVPFIEDSVSFYHKSKLVIGAETNPIKRVLPSQSASLIFVDIMGSLGMQDYRSVFVSPNSNAKVAPVICWEAVYGEFCTEYAQNGANVIVVPTNEGWWGNTPAPRQLWALSALRAIETRRSVARAANTGISGFIDYTGKTISKSEYGEQKALKHNIKLNEEITFYTLHGDYLGRIAGFLAVLLFVSALVRKLRNK